MVERIRLVSILPWKNESTLLSVASIAGLYQKSSTSHAHHHLDNPNNLSTFFNANRTDSSPGLGLSCYSGERRVALRCMNIVSTCPDYNTWGSSIITANQMLRDTYCCNYEENQYACSDNNSPNPQLTNGCRKERKENI